MPVGYWDRRSLHRGGDGAEPDSGRLSLYAKRLSCQLLVVADGLRNRQRTGLDNGRLHVGRGIATALAAINLPAETILLVEGIADCEHLVGLRALRQHGSGLVLGHAFDGFR